MKKQAESLTREYDRLLDEHSKLQVTHTNQHCQQHKPAVTVSGFLFNTLVHDLLFILNIQCIKRDSCFCQIIVKL